MESCYKEDPGKACYVIYIEGDQDSINTVPDDYPENNHGWTCPLEGLSFAFLRKLENRELQPRIWPRMDLQAHKITTLLSSYDYCNDIKDLNQDAPQAEGLNKNVYSLISEIEVAYKEAKQESILGLKKENNALGYLLFPKTIPVSDFKYQEKPYHYYPAGFPWSRLHISRTLRSVISKVLDTLDELRRWHFSDLNDVLDLNERYAHKHDWGYGGIKDPPDLIIGSGNFQALLELVETHHPAMRDRFLYWLELEQFYQEATELFEEFIDNPFTEPEAEEKERFINWLAGWINHGCVRASEHWAEIIADQGYPRRISQFNLPKCDPHEQSLDFYLFFADRLRWECLEALRDATIMCLSHSAEVQKRIPIALLEMLLPDYELRYGVHQCLGYGDCVQYAAYQRRDKILLLQVQTDKALFTNFGDGAIQFWISPEDLAAMRFSEVFMTAECT